MPKRVGVIKNEIFDGDDRVVIMWCPPFSPVGEAKRVRG
jgi:hypothetical protein